MHQSPDEVETHALEAITLDILNGEYIAIEGPSGCGKSTLLSILGFLDTPTGGSYTLNDRPVAQLKQAERVRTRNREIGFIFQSFNLIGDLTVYENVELPLTYRGMRPSERKARQTALGYVAPRSKFVEKASMTRWLGAREVLRIDVREGAVSHRELDDERGSDGDLHTLDGVHHSQSKLPVEDVPVPNYVERGARYEGAVCLLERVPVGTEAVVAHRLELPHEDVGIGDDQATLDQQRRLVRVGKGGLDELHCGGKRKTRQFEHGLAARGLAGVLRALSQPEQPGSKPTRPRGFQNRRCYRVGPLGHRRSRFRIRTSPVSDVSGGVLLLFRVLSTT